MQGRSQAEVNQIAALAVEQLARFNQSPAPLQHQPQHHPNGVPPVATRFDLDLPDDDFISGRQMKALLQQYGQSQGQGDPVARRLALSNTMQTIQQMEADAFKRWGPELHIEISKIPEAMRDLDNLQLVVQIVRGRHVQELVDEQARQQAARLTQEHVATIRSGTGGSTTIPNTQLDLKSDELPEHWRNLAQEHGLTMAAVQEFCQATGDTMESYFETVKKHGKGSVVHG